MKFREIIGQKWFIVISAALAFTIVHILLFPVFFASVDEHEYLKNSFLIQTGSLAEPDPTLVCTGDFNGSGYVSHFFIGRSLFLIPFTPFGFNAVMLSGLVIHLTNLFIFYRILKRLGYDPIYSILYLLYPAFFWEARTLNSEILVLTAIFSGVLFYLSRSRLEKFSLRLFKSPFLLSGLSFGLAALVRYESIILSFPFFLVPLVKDRKKFLSMLAGFIPVLLLILWANSLFYGGILSTGYGNPFTQVTEIGSNPHFWSNLGKFILLLSIAYPLMVFSPLFQKTLRTEILLSTILFLVFYSENASVAVFPTFHPSAFTAQLRYVIPLVGLLLISYPPFVERALKRIPIKKSLVLGAFFLALFSVFVLASIIHSNFLNDRYSIFSHIYSNTPDGSLLIGSADDCNYVLNEMFPDRYYLNVKSPLLKSYMNNFSNVYLLDISYSTVDPTTERGAVAVAERQAIKSFISSHSSMVPVYSTEKPHHLWIYRLKP